MWAQFSSQMHLPTLLNTQLRTSLTQLDSTRVPILLNKLDTTQSQPVYNSHQQIAHLCCLIVCAKYFMGINNCLLHISYISRLIYHFDSLYTENAKECNVFYCIYFYVYLWHMKVLLIFRTHLFCCAMLRRQYKNEFVLLLEMPPIWKTGCTLFFLLNQDWNECVR